MAPDPPPPIQQYKHTGSRHPLNHSVGGFLRCPGIQGTTQRRCNAAVLTGRARQQHKRHSCSSPPCAFRWPRESDWNGRMTARWGECGCRGLVCCLTCDTRSLLHSHDRSLLCASSPQRLQRFCLPPFLCLSSFDVCASRALSSGVRPWCSGARGLRPPSTDLPWTAEYLFP